MRKNLSTILLAPAKNNLLKTLFIGMAFLLYGEVMGQTTMFQFNFDGSSAPSTDNVIGTPAFSKIGTFSSSGTTACNGTGGITDAAWNTGDAYRFQVNSTGFSNLSFSYVERTSNTTISSFIVRVSTDLSSWTTIRTAYTPPTSCTSSGALSIPSNFSNQSTVYIEIYKTVDAGNTGNNMRIDDATLTGTAQATNITTGTITSSSIPTISCTNGTGAKRAIFMKQASTGSAAPVNNTTYTASGSNYTTGTQIGSTGWYCIFNGTGTPSVTINAGLVASTDYRIMVCEYDGAAGAEKYNTYDLGTNNPKTFTTAASSGTPSLSAGSLSSGFGNQCINTTSSTIPTFTITGSDLTSADVTVSGDAVYTFATTLGGTYSNPLNITQSGCSGSSCYSQTVYVKFTPTGASNYDGSITIGGGGASNTTTSVTGSGINGTPSVTTETASSIGTQTASSGGNTLSTTCGSITAKGVVWGTSANPTVPSVNSTNDGTGTSNYTSSISGLTENTVYNYRAYATNSNSITEYGSNLTFTTVSKPATSPSAAGATSDGFTASWAAPTGQGAASYTYTIEANTASDFSGTATLFTSLSGTSYLLTGLSSSTTYYFRIRVVNAGGNSTWANFTSGITTLSAPMWTNPITGTNPGLTSPYTAGNIVGASNLTVSGIVRGSGVSGATGNDRYNASGWSTGALLTTDYFSFTLTPASGYEIDFTNFIYTGQASGNGPTSFSFRSSLDSYGSSIGTANVGGTTIDLSGSTYQNISSAIEFRFYGFNATTGGGTFSIDDFTFNGTVSAAAPSITNVTVATTPFCVSANGSASGTVSYTAPVAFNGGNSFTAYLSDVSGNFPGTTLQSTSGTGSGSISITIPQNTATGSLYKIRVDGSNPVTTGSVSSAFTINLGPADVTAQAATSGNTQSIVTWTNPATCFDDIMIVAKAGAFSGAIPSGTAYTHNSNSFTDGANTTFDGGKVVYRGTGSPQTITNLTNGVSYTFKIFARKNNDWSAGVITSATPAVANYVLFDNFDRTDNSTVGTPSSGGSDWSETEAIAGLCEIYNSRHDINNNNPQGKAWTYYDMSSKYSTVFSAASKTLTWVFNMSQTRPDPSGFGTSSYGVAFVLGADESNFISTTCDGYAVVLGQSGATDAVKLVRFSGGITANSNFTDIISFGDYADQALRIKVEFNPCTSEWKLFLDDDGSPADDLFIFSDPTTVTTQRGSTTSNNTHTSLDLKYMGCLWSYATSAGEYASFDNISIPDATTIGAYTWNGGTSDYQTSTNWTPTRSCPQPTDVLQFNNGVPNTVTNVPTQTIARLTVSVSGTTVNLQSAAAANILTLQGGTGTDLDVANGTQLNINGTNDFTIQLATGATGSISGNMTFSNGTHKLKSVDNQSLTFNSGAIFTTGTNFAGNAFGASTVNQPQIVFASGSTYVYQSGGNPFGASQPNSVLVFQSGSLYKHASNAGLPSFAGRNYANFEFDFTGSPMSSISGSTSTCTIAGNMTYTNGTHNFLHQQPINITGNLNVTSGNSFNYSPAVASTFNFNGGSAQTIGGGGSITFGANAMLQISNNTSLTSTVNVFGIASVTAGTLTSSGNLVIENNANLLHGAGTTLGGGSVSGNIVVKRNGTSSATVYNYWSTPITSASLGLLGGTNYLYNPANGTADFSDDNPGPDPGWAAASGLFSVGKGYAGQGPNPTVTFTGTANNGNLTTGVQYFTLVNGSTSPGVPYNLIGNPYPSNIDAASFLTANNTKVTGAIYYWDDDNTGGTGYAANDYAIWNGTGSTGGGGRTPNGMIATAQGFFVQTLSGATSVSFTNAMRAATATTFFKTEEVIPQRLWLRADNGTHTNQILVGYVEGATEDMDWFYDAQKLRGNHSVSFYSLLNDTILLGIQGLTPLNGADPSPVPLGLYSGATGQYSIYIDSIENFPSNMPITLLDSDLGIIYDLRNGPYQFQTTQGEDNDRFILFHNEIVTALDEQEKIRLNVYPNPNNGTFTVMINSGIEQQVKISLFDVTGKSVLAADKAISSGNNFITLENQIAGVYLLKIETADKTYNKRVVIY